MMIFYCHISFLGWFLVEKRNNLLFPMVTPFQDELLRIHRQLTGWKQRLPHEAEDDPSLGTTPPGRWWCGWGVFTQKKKTLPRGNQGCEMAEFYPCFFVAEGKSSFDTKVVCDLKPDQVRAWNMTMYRMVVFFSQDAISTQDAIEEWKTCISLRELRWPYLIFKRNLQLRLHWCFWL